jgi:hypothetical protein
MALYRPHVPLTVRCVVAERQVREVFKTELTALAIEDAKTIYPSKARLLDWLLGLVAKRFGCEPADLRLDHDPALALRPMERRGLSRKVFYVPDANDPEHLFYRPHGAQFDGSHDVKTRIRGDHGQYSDVALIKRERRRQRREEASAKNLKKKRPKWRSAKMGKKPKTRWPSRKFGSKKSPGRFGGG